MFQSVKNKAPLLSPQPVCPAAAGQGAGTRPSLDAVAAQRSRCQAPGTTPPRLTSFLSRACGSAVLLAPTVIHTEQTVLPARQAHSILDAGTEWYILLDKANVFESLGMIGLGVVVFYALPTVVVLGLMVLTKQREDPAPLPDPEPQPEPLPELPPPPAHKDSNGQTLGVGDRVLLDDEEDTGIWVVKPCFSPAHIRVTQPSQTRKGLPVRVSLMKKPEDVVRIPDKADLVLATYEPDEPDLAIDPV